jgi:hypothetical protein
MKTKPLKRIYMEPRTDNSLRNLQERRRQKSYFGGHQAYLPKISPSWYSLTRIVKTFWHQSWSFWTVSNWEWPEIDHTILLFIDRCLKSWGNWPKQSGYSNLGHPMENLSNFLIDMSNLKYFVWHFYTTCYFWNSRNANASYTYLNCVFHSQLCM